MPIECYIACQKGSSPIEIFRGKAIAVEERVAPLVTLFIKGKEKGVLAKREGLNMIMTGGMWNSFQIDGRMRDEKRKITGKKRYV